MYLLEYWLECWPVGAAHRQTPKKERERMEREESNGTEMKPATEASRDGDTAATQGPGPSAWL